jgi:hypothetical protein
MLRENNASGNDLAKATQLKSPRRSDMEPGANFLRRLA